MALQPRQPTKRFVEGQAREFDVSLGEGMGGSMNGVGGQDLKRIEHPKSETEKLSGWVKEPSVKDLKEDLQSAEPSHSAHALDVKRWMGLRNVLSQSMRDATEPHNDSPFGGSRRKAGKTRSTIQPKLIRRQQEWRYSALSEPFLSSKKLFSASPATFEDRAAAEQTEALLNWQFRTKIRKVAFIDEYVRTAVDEGSVIVRLGWRRETRKVKSTVPLYAYQPVTNPQIDAQLQQASQLKMQNPAGFAELPEHIQASVEYSMEKGGPFLAQPAGTKEVEDEEVLVNQPTVQVIDPENFYVDPACEGDLDKANFVIVSIETSRAELKKDGRYKNLDAVNWSGASVLAEPDHATQTPNSFQPREDLRKPVVMFEYWGLWDINGDDTLVPIVASWIGDTMIRMELNPFPDEKPPFVVASYLPRRRQLMGEPDAEILDDNQQILGAVTRGMIDLMGKSANGQTGTAKGFLDVTNQRRFARGEDYEFNPGAGDPRLSVYHHVYPEIPNSAVTMVNLQNYEAEALSGVKSFAGGLSGDAYGDVAANTKGVLDASAKREMNILRRLADGICQIGTKIAAMNTVFLSDEEVIAVTNQQFVTISREKLIGNYDVIVDISTPEIDQAQAQDLGFMLQTMGPDMDPAMSRMILSDIAKLKRMPELAHRILTFQPQPDPMVEELKKLEIEKIRKEIALLDAEIAQKQADAQKKTSEADLNTLEFVEQESGTHHARELQKQGEQARANQDLEVTKALVAPKKPEQRDPDVMAAVGFNRLSDLQMAR